MIDYNLNITFVMNRNINLIIIQDKFDYRKLLNDRYWETDWNRNKREDWDGSIKVPGASFLNKMFLNLTNTLLKRDILKKMSKKAPRGVNNMIECMQQYFT